MAYTTDSHGYATGLFLTTNSFELMERLEAHDTYHVLAGYGTNVPDEIAQQYFLFGNGKKTLYVIGVLLLSILLLPDNMPQYLAAYRRGTKCNPIHLLDMKSLLNTPLQDIQNQIFNTSMHIRCSATVHSIDLFKI